MPRPMLDCLVIGGGAAGLMAAVYLGRYRRNALVVDDGGSRLGMIPLSRNVMGWQVRYCPVCDGFETQGQRVAVLGPETHGLCEAVFVAGFGNGVTWLSMGSLGKVAERELAGLRGAGVQVVDGRLRDIVCRAGEGVTVEMDDGRVLGFDVLYPALGLTHASQLATALGARAEDDGQLVVDDHYETTVPGLYAAGDVAVGLNQINVAAGQAAIAATAIHNRL